MWNYPGNMIFRCVWKWVIPQNGNTNRQNAQHGMLEHPIFRQTQHNLNHQEWGFYMILPRDWLHWLLYLWIKRGLLKHILKWHQTRMKNVYINDMDVPDFLGWIPGGPFQDQIIFSWWQWMACSWCRWYSYKIQRQWWWWWCEFIMFIPQNRMMMMILMMMMTMMMMIFYLTHVRIFYPTFHVAFYVAFMLACLLRTGEYGT